MIHAHIHEKTICVAIHINVWRLIKNVIYIPIILMIQNNRLKLFIPMYSVFFFRITRHDGEVLNQNYYDIKKDDHFIKYSIIMLLENWCDICNKSKPLFYTSKVL